jgi:aldehyde dehydrogenase (NAD+)
LSDADLDLATREIVRSVFATSGQRCSSAGRIIVEEGVLVPLTERLVEAVGTLILGNGLDINTDVGPIINETRLENIERDVAQALHQGATALCGGGRAQEGGLGAGFFYKPTLLANVDPNMAIAQEENFGPVATILPVRDIYHALEIANGVTYGLTSAVFTQDINKALFMAHEIEAGAFFVNTACVGAEIHLPFGGMKGSGNGSREGAHHMLDIYTEWKSVSIQREDP